MKKTIMSVCLALLISVVVSAPVMAQSLKKVKIVEPRNSVFA